MTALAMILGLTLGNLLYHGAYGGDWERAIGVSAITAILIGIIYAATGYPK